MSQNKETNLVALGAFVVMCVLPMVVGIFSKDIDMAETGAVSAVIAAFGWGWWKWYSR